MPLEELEVKDDLTYEEQPVKILEIAERITRSKTIRMFKVQCVETSGLRQRGGDRGLRPSSVALRPRLGIGTTGGRVRNWLGKLRFH